MPLWLGKNAQSREILIAVPNFGDEQFVESIGQRTRHQLLASVIPQAGSRVRRSGWFAATTVSVREREKSDVA